MDLNKLISSFIMGKREVGAFLISALGKSPEVIGLGVVRPLIPFFNI